MGKSKSIEKISPFPNLSLNILIAQQNKRCSKKIVSIIPVCKTIHLEQPFNHKACLKIFHSIKKN